MADSTINNLSSGTTPLAGTEEIPIVQGSSTVKITAQDIADLAGGDNIGNSDLTIDTTGTRKLIMGGASSSDEFVIRNSADSSDYFKVQGDGFTNVLSLQVENTNPNISLLSGARSSTLSMTSAGQTTLKSDSTNFLDLWGAGAVNMRIGNGITFYKDRILSGAGTHLTRLGGNLVTDTHIFETASGTDILGIRGDNSLYMVNGTAGFGIVPSSSTTMYIGNSGGKTNALQVNPTGGNHGIFARGSATNCIYIESSTANQKGIYLLNSTTSGTARMIDIDSSSASSGSKRGIELNITGGATNYAINILNGDIQTTTSTDRILSGAGTHKTIMGGALSSDVFAIRNSADTQNLFEVQGAGLVKFENGASQIDGSSVLFGQSGANNFIQLNGSNNRIYSLNNSFITTLGTGGFTFDTSITDMHVYQGTFQVGNTLQAPSGATNSILIESGTAPTVNKADRHWYYSKDIVAGNSAPHWKTENGDVLKLYKNTSLTASDGTLATAITRQAEIETILQNLGIL